jgi:hypothetical protein
MVKLFRRFVEYLALAILIGGAIVVFTLLGRAFKAQYLNGADTPPAQEIVKDS